MVNSCAKGKVGEREWAEYLREQGYEARRGRQFSGSPESPDVVSSVPGVHWEVKRTQRLQAYPFMDQAASEAGEGEMPIIAYRANNKDWLCILRAEDLMKLIKNQKEENKA